MENFLQADACVGDSEARSWFEQSSCSSTRLLIHWLVWRWRIAWIDVNVKSIHEWLKCKKVFMWHSCVSKQSSTQQSCRVFPLQVSVAHAATSPMQTSRMVSTGLQAVPTLQDAAPLLHVIWSVPSGDQQIQRPSPRQWVTPEAMTRWSPRKCSRAWRSWGTVLILLEAGSCWSWQNLQGVELEEYRIIY